jgi:branched-chain amino acid transport system permease protein
VTLTSDAAATATGARRSTVLDRLREQVSQSGGRGLQLTFALVAVLSIIFIVKDGPSLFWKRFLDGMANGFIYGAVALALVLIYKATGVINFAQGSLAMFFTFVAWVLASEQSWPVWLAIVVAMALSAIVAAVIERVLIRPFDPSNHLPITIITIALLSLIDGLALLIWFADPKGFPSPFPSNAKQDVVQIFGAKVFYSTIGVWVTVIVTAVLLTMLLNRTKIGLAFRAVSSNLESSRLVGIHVGRTLQFGWALAAAIGTLAGCLVMSTGVTQLQPLFMAQILVFAFAAATIGGLDSLAGAVVGGLLVAQLETMLRGYFPVFKSLELAAVLVVVIIVLLVRPNGLFGSKRVERV